LSWTASDVMAEALREHEALVADEVLATSMSEGVSDGSQEFGDEELGLKFWLRRSQG
jgi:isoleucyl-tRNA synthetase